MKYYALLAFLLIISSSAFGECRQLINRLAIGPEAYWVNRTREGGTKQTGTLWGGRITYERIKRYGWYIGGDALYATGKLEGKSNSGDKIRSILTDTNFEGRFGYTLQRKSDSGFFFTPFVGLGYFRERNNFCHPTPLHIHFCNKFSYIAFGFLSHVYVRENIGIGLNLKMRYPYQHKIVATNDPEFEKLTLHYQENLQYRVELPMTWDTCVYDRLWEVSFAPFYEYRNYGRLAGFPFDFLRTKFQIYGANLQIILLF